MTPQEYGQNLLVHIVKIINEHKTKLTKYPGQNQFIFSDHDYQFKFIIPYNDIINKIENQEDEYIVRKFKRMFAHEGPPNYSHHN